MTDTKELRRLAEAATQGEWCVDEDDRPGMEWNRQIMSAPSQTVCFMAHSGGKDPEQDEATAHYIAAASPSVVLALLDEVEEMRQIFRWLLGAAGEFPHREEGMGAYWWRKDLLARLHEAGIVGLASPQPEKETGSADQA